MGNSVVTKAYSKWLRLLLVFSLLGIVALLAGLQFARMYLLPARHPLTGRQIAGITTNPNWLDRSEREREEDPERALDLIGITPGMIVADVGAGSGYMTVRLARRVGPAGKVYANDLQPALLQIIADKAGAEHLSNITIVQGADDDTRLPAGAFDVVLLVDVYHEFSRPQAMLRSILRSLKPDGRMVLVEYRKEDPSIPIAELHRMSVAEARTEVEAEGFAFDGVIEGLPRQHIISFRKPKSPASAP
ncbi:MAG: class I SAM-dependent methyltransferase [Candidatus Binataceae bacterium]